MSEGTLNFSKGAISNALNLISPSQSPEESREKDPTPGDLLQLKSSRRPTKDLRQKDYGVQQEGG